MPTRSDERKQNAGYYAKSRRGVTGNVAHLKRHKRQLTLFFTAAIATAIVLMAWSSAADADATATTFTPTDDARVAEAFPNAKYGLYNLFTSGTAGEQHEAFLKFDVSGLTGEVKSAILRVYVYDETTDGPAVYAADTNWSEATLTWNTKPAMTGTGVADAGYVPAEGYYDFDVTSLVSGNGTYSFDLRQPGSDGMRAFGKEKVRAYGEEAADLHPELIVNTTPAAPDPVVLAAGDIADGHDQDEATAQLLRSTPGTVLAVGDLAYPDGSLDAFQTNYDPTWGTEKSRTKPVPGNHEYVHGTYAMSQFGVGYFDYWNGTANQTGPAGDRDKGYYSYDLGDWHLIALNTGQCYDQRTIINGYFQKCAPDSPMLTWLEQDLSQNTKLCTLAYFHHPRYSSGTDHGDDPQRTGAIWETLYTHDADVVINGHEHDYERFAPQDNHANADPKRGIREFVAGTGGGWVAPDLGGNYFTDPPKPNSEVRAVPAWGVLKMVLHPGSYDFQFLPAAGTTFTDSGNGSCH
jgi:acid phosphatase type 7